MATAVAAFAARARREVEQLFLDNDAFSPERAVEFEARTAIQQRYMDELIAEGVVHEVEPGRYWFDRRAFQEMRRQRLAWTMRILVVGLLVFLVILAVRAVTHLG
jgi:hypothetical protein